MALTLLKTKLYIPPARPTLVSRPRLVARLNESLRPGIKLALVSAPAGFGKTTLLGEWVAGCTQDTRVAWVSLDEADNDLTRFLTYLVAAVQTVVPGLGADALAAMQSPRPPAAETVLATLSNDLADHPGTLVLVLDDYHEITAEPVHDALLFLLDHLPPHAHLVLATRVNPPWPLARLRARQEMIELRTQDLRFATDQAAAFLKDVMGLDLSAEDIAALDSRTEGWIAGLQMAALSMQGRDATRAAAFIQAFGGCHRFVLDYLVEEVLGQQPEDVQRFMLRTSILDRLTAPLCDAVAGIDNSQALLARMERENLFVIPLDDERRWYRYHALYADLLRSRLEDLEPGLGARLHGRASAWNEESGLIAQAVRHALETGDAQRVAHLVAEHALDAIYYGELAGLARSLATLPRKIKHAQPWLHVAYAWAAAYAGQLAAVQEAIDEARAAAVGLEDTRQAEHIAGHLAAVRAYAADLSGDLGHAVSTMRKALDLLPEQESTVRAFVLSLLGTALRDSGDLDAAQRASAEAVALSSAAGDARVTVTALCELAILHIWRGKLHRAADACRQAIEIVQAFARQRGHPLPVTALAYARLALVHVEWHQLEDALRCAREAVRLCEPWGQADVSITAYSRLSSVLAATGDVAGAHEALGRARAIAESVSPWYGALLASREAAMHLARGDLDAATGWARESGLRYDDEFDTDGEAQYGLLARVLAAQGKLDEALVLLNRLLEQARAANAIPQILGALTLRAPILDARGRHEEALATLERALVLAEPEGYVRPFVSGGAPIHQLLKEIASQASTPGYVARLLAAFDRATEGARPAGTAPPRSHPHPSALVEPLSERELQVLRLLQGSLSQRQIADELYISVNTARTHVKHIYTKLDVHSREEAVQRAQELGLL